MYIKSLLQKNIQSLEPYISPQALDSKIAALNVNENPFSLSYGAKKDIINKIYKALKKINRYPLRDAGELREALANYLQNAQKVLEPNIYQSIDLAYKHKTLNSENINLSDKNLESVRLAKENIWAANGSNEALLQLFLAFGGAGRKCLIFSPTYSMYPFFCKISSTDLIDAPRRTDFGIDIDLAFKAIKENRPDIILLCNPNNPTGSYISLDIIDKICSLTQELGKGIVIIDEAYIEFSQMPSAINLLSKYNNLVVLRTLSKAFGLAGLRLGFVATSEEIVDALKVVSMPYHLSSLSQAAAIAALNYKDAAFKNIKEITRAREGLMRQISSAVKLYKSEFEIFDSFANFIYFDCKSDIIADKLYEFLKNKGVLVRKTGPQSCLRVSIGSKKQNKKFIEIFNAFLISNKI